MVTDTQHSLGNKVVLVGGDMCQILPIFKGLSGPAIIDRVLTSWPLWSTRQSFELIESTRAPDDPVFADWVQKIGTGEANTLNGKSDVLLLRDEIVLKVGKDTPSKSKTRAKTQKKTMPLPSQISRCDKPAPGREKSKTGESLDSRQKNYSSTEKNSEAQCEEDDDEEDQLMSMLITKVNQFMLLFIDTLLGSSHNVLNFVFFFF